MSDSEDSTEYWFKTTPLEGSRSIGRLRRPGSGSSAIREFASANGFLYHPRSAHDDAPPSIILEDGGKDVVYRREPTWVEFGNHGWKYWMGDNDFKPSRRGFIAIEHGLQLPHMYLKATAQALTPLNVASNALTFLAIFDNAEGAPFNSSLQVFAKRSDEIELPEGVGFDARAEASRVAEARELLSSEVLPFLNEVARSFDVEVRDNWILAYSMFGDISTNDPEVWAWAFSVASRLFDLIALWGGPVQSEAFALYTERWIDRPSKLDGSLRFVLKGLK